MFMFALFFNLAFVSAQKLHTIVTPDGTLVLEGPDSILLYVTTLNSLDGRYGRTDYIHPLWGLNGERLTLDFPEDHLHHRGIFWAWRRIRVGDLDAGDSWVCKEFSWDVRHVHVEKTGDSLMTLRAEVYWLSSGIRDEYGKQKPFVLEEVNIRVHRRKLHYRLLDMTIRLKALVEDVAIAGYDNESALSGFSARIKTPDDLVIASTMGKLTPQWPAMKAGAWVDFSGTFSPAGLPSGLTILIDKQNPAPKQMWNLRQKDSMQNVVFPGSKPYILPTNDFLFLRYRLVIHDDHVNTKEINDLYKTFNE
jgi:hypothetical protein